MGEYMKKNGFVFVETIVVLVVLVAGITTLFTTYIKLSSIMDRRKYYDNVSDIYKVNFMRSNFYVYTVGTGFAHLTNQNCMNHIIGGCADKMNELGITDIYVNNDIRIEEVDTEGLPNSLVDYMKTLKTKDYQRYIIGCFNRDGHYYYASLKI